MDTLDIRGLPREKVKYLEQLIQKWRQEEKDQQDGEEEEIVFPTHKSNVIGKLTRAAAYED